MSASGPQADIGQKRRGTANALRCCGRNIWTGLPAFTCYPLPMKSPQKARKREMSKQAMREETERLVKEALERKTITVKQGRTRIDSKCRKCGALNRVSADQGQVRVSYVCKECGEKQSTF